MEKRSIILEQMKNIKEEDINSHDIVNITRVIDYPNLK